MTSEITVDRALQDRVAVVHFAFCERNTFNLSRITALMRALDSVLRDRSVRAVVFASGVKGFFSDGYSIEGLFGSEVRKRILKGDFRAYDQVRTFYRRLIEIPIPTVCFVDGVCSGAGLEWALCTDFILATPDSSFAFHEIRLGIVPGLGGFHLLAMRLSPPLATHMLLTAEVLNAKQANSAGLIDALVDHLDAALSGFVAPLAQRPRAGLVRMKSLTGTHQKKLAALEACQEAFREALRERVSRGLDHR